MSILNKLYFNLKLFWHALFYGMKGANAVMESNQKTNDGISFEVSDNSGGGVFKDILEERVTQEVEELRYASYVVANESKKYKYVGNGKVKKKKQTQLSEKHGQIEESDKLPIILIQDNNVICEDVLTVLNEVDNKDNKKLFHDYNIKIKRDLFPRFLIESYVKKIVLKESDGNYVIDLYCSKYPRQFNEKKDRAFISEIKKIKDKKVRNSDIFDFQELSFTTLNAWGIDDWFHFSFVDFEFYDIIEFDGNYVIRFGCQSNVFMENLVDKVFSETAEKKYQNKEARENAVIDFSSYISNNEYHIDDTIDLNALENVKFSIDNNDK